MERGRERSSIVRALEAVEVRSRGGLVVGAGAGVVSVGVSPEGAERVEASMLLRGGMMSVVWLWCQMAFETRCMVLC